jgi:hypothetical protein
LTGADDEELRHFFGAYFHQDWDLDASSAEGVFALYVQDSTTEHRRRVIDQLARLARDTHDDAALDEKLFELGCYYSPTAEGKTSRQWMQDVMAILRRSLESEA